MQGRVVLFNIGDVPVVLHPSYCIWLVLLFGGFAGAAPEHRLALAYVCAVSVTGSIILQASGRALAARRLGLRPIAIEINGFGAMTYLSGDPERLGSRTLIWLAGPAVNVALVVMAGAAILLIAGLNAALANGEAIYKPIGIYQAIVALALANGILCLINLLRRGGWRAI